MLPISRPKRPEQRNKWRQAFIETTGRWKGGRYAKTHDELNTKSRVVISGRCRSCSCIHGVKRMWLQHYKVMTVNEDEAKHTAL